MKFILFGDDGVMVARYDSKIHGDDIPSGAVDVSDDLFFQTISENDGVWKLDKDTGGIAKHPFPSPTIEQLATAARSDRDARLTASDWVTLRAYEIGEEVPSEWLRYRAALRDITLQSGFPQVIDWPQPPA